MARPLAADDMPGLPWTIERVERDGSERIDDQVVLEEPLEIRINGSSVAVLMRMPGQEKELAAGFCLTEGYIRRVTDIQLIHHCGLGHPVPGQDDALGGSRNQIEVRASAEGFCPPDRPDVIRLIRSGCGAADVTALSADLPRVSHSLSVPAAVVLGLDRAMRDRQEIHRQIGGTHAAALFDTVGQVVVLAEDIGRHNAVDKAVGHCMLRDIPLHDKIMVTSGRASYEMVSKAIRAGIAIVASVSAPTALAVQLAEDRGLTLIGYLRGGRMNVYTHGSRLER